MRGIERIYNKYFRDVFDKITLAAIIIYGVMIIMLMIIRNGTFEKTIVKITLNNLCGILTWSIGIIPAIRYYKIIITGNVLEKITPKNYRDRLLMVLRLYGVMICIFICLLTIHKLILPILTSDFDDINNIIYSFRGNLATVSFFIMIGLMCIESSISQYQRKVSKGFILAMACFIPFISDKICGWINSSISISLYSGAYKMDSVYAIAINVGLSIVLVITTLKNINKLDFRKK